MRPSAKFDGFHEKTKKVVINGPRPSTLMINKDSHLIRKPIIIYTESPKVIHTKAQDFMALVQRLTGMPHQEASEKQGCSDHGDETRRDHDETCINVQNSPSNYVGFADMPLFTPNSSDFFCSYRSVFKNSDSPYGILGSLISPSGLEFLKELPEY